MRNQICTKHKEGILDLVHELLDPVVQRRIAPDVTKKYFELCRVRPLRRSPCCASDAASVASRRTQREHGMGASAWRPEGGKAAYNSNQIVFCDIVSSCLDTLWEASVLRTFTRGLHALILINWFNCLFIWSRQ